ncbi:hypothetical protein AWB78_05940 [Caballeronia calidae]|uniref:Uncharacterized protein n=1 Tax=Caballeronia calidae TaxID=1777139 RepID=A0A158E1Q3_9BURK|nr:hypothetical protein AWB78_05940 [Caballeronia calidae]
MTVNLCPCRQLVWNRGALCAVHDENSSEGPAAGRLS